MEKIKMTTPLVEMDGDEMTRVLWKMIKDELILPFVELKTEYYDLGLLHRNETKDQVTVEAANATRRLGVAVKCATITPNKQRMVEYPQLTEMWKSPNGTIRSILDGPVFGKGEADILVALEKMEAVRYAEFLKPGGVAVINDYAIKSTTIASGAETYPEGCVEAMAKVFRTIAVPASDMALGLGNPKCMNVVLFGAMCDSLGCPQIDWEQVVADTVPEKVRELNLRAFRAGRQAAQQR